MDLIKLADDLSIDDIAELIARKLLQQEQELCRDICNDDTVAEKDKRPYRNTLANAEALGEQTQEAVHEKLFHYHTFVDSVNSKIINIADEYTRII